MKLVFGPLGVDRPVLEGQWGMLLGVVADFSVVLGESRLLHEEMFPVVELARSLQHWLDDLDMGVVQDFSYESMESAEGPLLQFLQGDRGWKIRSPLQEFEQEGALTTEEVRDAARQFVEGIQREAEAQLSLGLAELLRRH